MAGSGFPAPVKSRFLLLMHFDDGTNIASIAEFDVLGAELVSLRHANRGRLCMPIVKKRVVENRTAHKVFDLQESTFWQTVDNTAYPHQLVIDLGKRIRLPDSGTLPRAEAGAPHLLARIIKFMCKS